MTLQELQDLKELCLSYADGSQGGTILDEEELDKIEAQFAVLASALAFYNANMGM